MANRASVTSVWAWIYNELVLFRLVFFMELEEPRQEEELVVGVGISLDDILKVDLPIPS